MKRPLLSNSCTLLKICQYSASFKFALTAVLATLRHQLWGFKMRSVFVALSAILVVVISSVSQAQIQEVKPADGRFYCQGVFNWDLRMDVDFVGNRASAEIYNVKTGDRTYNFGYFDDLKSNLITTRYLMSPRAQIEFPADYEIRHWFQLTYNDSYGWIRFDCNHF